MSIQAQAETRLECILPPNGTANGVDLSKVGAVEKVAGPVYAADQSTVHRVFAHPQGSPIDLGISRLGKSVPRISMTGTKAVCFVMAAFLLSATSMLTAQAPVSSASKAESTVSPNPIAPPPNESAELAQKLTNPLAALISVPIQNWFDFNLGPTKDGFRYTIEAQPVYPVQISKNWNLLSRTTIPVTYQQNVYGRTTQTGLSDSTESIFLSPVHTKSIIWGAGPIFLVPTGTNGLLSTRKFAIGPTAVALKHKGHTNVGLLASHVWSVAGSDSHPPVSETYAQPFVAYTTTKAWTFAATSYDTYNWTAGRWTAIVNPIRISKLVKLGQQRLSVGGALRCTVTSPQYQPKGCGLEFTVTPVYPARRE
jgi:hypothetical protein